MPQMGESIAEGTIVRWIKKVGDTVDRDEPLFEISTDKVDAEIPSPAAGTLLEIAVKEGETVPVNSVVAHDRRRGERCGSRARARAEGGAGRCGQRPPPPPRQDRAADAAGRRLARRSRRRPSPRRRLIAAAPDATAATAAEPASRRDRAGRSRRRWFAASRRSTASISVRSPAPASPAA